jgi:hypothetical protein
MFICKVLVVTVNLQYIFVFSTYLCSVELSSYLEKGLRLCSKFTGVKNHLNVMCFEIYLSYVEEFALFHSINKT